MSDPRNDAHGKKVGQGKKKREPAEVATAEPSVERQGSLEVLAKLKQLEFHSRAAIEQLAALALTVEDELKQKQFAAPLSEVYAAQSTVQTRLTALSALIEMYSDRLED